MFKQLRYKPLEPGVLRIFRYFAVVAVVYFMFIATYAFFANHQLFTPSQIAIYLNLTSFALLAIYLSWDWLRRKLKELYFPIALIIATVPPILSMILYAPVSPSNLTYVIIGSWTLFPILLIPLVLIAWQYNFATVISFIIITALIDFIVIWNAVGEVNLDTLPLLGVPFIRAFAFGAVGHIIVNLMQAQNEQRRKLVRANLKLAEYAKTQEQLATSRERNRLARELHDTLAHTLSGLTVNLEAIKLVMQDDPAEVVPLIDEALNNTRLGLTETRRALKALRPKRLEDLGLGMAVMNLAEDAAHRANAELDVDIDTSLPDLPQDTEQVIYRQAQESLQNVVKHADAKHVIVRLKRHGRMLNLEVRDDGKGMNNVSPDGHFDSMGLRSMQERAEMIGGKLEISSVPNKGTVVRFMMELNYDPDFAL